MASIAQVVRALLDENEISNLDYCIPSIRVIVSVLIVPNLFVKMVNNG